MVSSFQQKHISPNIREKFDFLVDFHEHSKNYRFFGIRKYFSIFILILIMPLLSGSKVPHRFDDINRTTYVCKNSTYI